MDNARDIERRVHAEIAAPTATDLVALFQQSDAPKLWMTWCWSLISIVMLVVPPNANAVPAISIQTAAP